MCFVTACWPATSASSSSVMATSPVATADDQGGPLGGAGVVSLLPSDIAIEAVGAPAGPLAATEQVNLAIHGTGFTVGDVLSNAHRAEHAR